MKSAWSEKATGASRRTKSAPALPAWSPADYAANSAVQQSWAREMMARLKVRGDERILDVGCGDGKITVELARAVPRGSVVGLDGSAEMIGFARKTFPASEIPNLKFQIADAREIGGMRHWFPSPHRGEGRREEAKVSSASKLITPTLSPPGRGEGECINQFDVVFSNAALHWVDDHGAILRGAASVLKAGGRLVVSCGGQGNAHDVFLALRPEMRLKRWREFFRRMPMPYYFYAPSDYEKWLPEAGFRIQRLKLAPKAATYAGAAGFATWLRTTWLPFTQRVPEAMREEFIADVTRRYIAKHPPDAAGQIPVRMVRLEIEAVKI